MSKKIGTSPSKKFSYTRAPSLMRNSVSATASMIAGRPKPKKAAATKMATTPPNAHSFLAVLEYRFEQQHMVHGGNWPVGDSVRMRPQPYVALFCEGLPSHSSFSSANSSNDMKECLDASCDMADGSDTYRMFSFGLKTVSQLLHFCGVTKSFSVMAVGADWLSTS
uniref:Uncharacterized protein n=1 Tax=Anopheles farauti TaxID=69004 RepID=A0A182Q4Q5_9DIPT